MNRDMLEGWGEFYLLTGTAASVLIGLLFVVVTLMQDRPRSSVLSGSRLYMGPVVLHVSLILVLSAAALVPRITPRALAVIAGAVAIAGAVRGCFVIAGIMRLSEREPESPHWSDVWCYGVIPALFYLLLAIVAAGFWNETAWAADALAAVMIALLLISIRNEWDLVIWLAPKPDSKEPSEEPKE
jgi:hypothetical protein